MVSEYASYMNKYMFFGDYGVCVGASEQHVRTSVCPGSERGAIVDTARATESS